MIYIMAILVIGGLFTALAVLLLVAERYLVNCGPCTLGINEGSRVLQVKGGGTLLSALYENKVFIPSACGGKGSCGYCKVTVATGGGPVLPTETPFLSRQEVRSGVRLACQVKIKQDLEIRIPEELLNVKQYQARVSLVRDLTRDIKQVDFDLLDPVEINQRPGQYVQIQAPGPEGSVFRAYSISSPFYEKNRVQLNVRLVPGGIASTYIHGLKKNDEVVLTGPYGEFRLSEDPEREIICVGGGCGMAPMRNIIYSLYHRWPERSCWLFFGCRTAKDVFYLEEYRQLAKEHPQLKVVYALSDPLGPDEAWDGETGFIHLAVDKRLAPGVKRQAFLCGPPPMIEAVMDVLKTKGLGDSDIFYDKF